MTRAWTRRRMRDCSEDDDNALLCRRDPLIILIPPAFPLSSACPPPYRLPSVSCDPGSLPSSLRIPFRDAERKTSLPGDIGASKKGGGGGGAGWRGTFLFRHKFNMSDMTAGTRRREGRSRMLARGPSCRLCSSCSLGLLARSAQYIFMKDVTGGGRASCGRREAVNVPQACFHVASQVMDSRLEAPCSVRHCREHFYLIAYLARELTRTLHTNSNRYRPQKLLK